MDFRFVHLNVSAALCPPVATREILLQRKMGRSQALLEETEVLPEINDVQRVNRVFFGVADCEVKPLVVSDSICVVIDQQHVRVPID